MNYHISTGLILQNFNPKSECPLCEIRQIVERNTVDQFLNEAVMIDSARDKANKKGFCAHHYDMMINRQNKLGVALQTMTRLDKTLMNIIEPPKNYKTAVKQAEELKKCLSTCLICDLIDDNMERYYKTVAQMYYNEPSFRDILLSTKGFCLNDYIGLLRHANEAKSKADEYVKTLGELQVKNMERMQKELQWFCDKHDYRNRDLPIGTSADILQRIRVKLYTKPTK